MEEPTTPNDPAPAQETADVTPPSPTPGPDTTPPSETVAPRRPRRPLTKAAKIAIAAGFLSVCGLVGYALSAYRKQVTQPIAVASPTPTFAPEEASPTPAPTPALVPSQLNGVLVSPGKERLHPLAVMIENHPEARPQAGLGQADLVYEAVAEGGITRFMAVFADPEAAVRVGPIRSARPYFVDFATELKAFYAHAGGSIDALNQIKSTGVLAIDGLSLGEPTFRRDLSRGVGYEHTLYSSTDALWRYATESRRWSKEASYEPWNFQDDAPADQRPAAHTASVAVSDPLYATAWSYDPASNSYLRSMAGAIHKDATTGRQISAKSVILQTTSAQPYTEYYGNIAKSVTRITVTGSGAAVVMQNGKAIKATWKRSGTDRTRYYDESGAEIPLVRGLIWVQIIHPDSRVSY